MLRTANMENMDMIAIPSGRHTTINDAMYESKDLPMKRLHKFFSLPVSTFACSEQSFNIMYMTKQHINRKLLTKTKL